MDTENLAVPKGNTQVGVNALIYQTITNLGYLKPNSTWIDAPAGEGDWLEFVKNRHPQVKWLGLEIQPHEKSKALGIVQVNCAESILHVLPEKVDGVTCISGVMAFDNQTRFFSEISSKMNPGAPIFVTNDNIVTVRDRFNFLFSGTFKRFKMFYEPTEGNWKVHTIESLSRTLQNANFAVKKVSYCSVYKEDWLLLPLAIPIYIMQSLYILKASLKQKKSFSHFLTNLRRKPFVSLLARHYVILAEKKNMALVFASGNWFDLSVLSF